MLVDIAEYRISDWRFPDTSNLVLRIIPNETFVAEDGADGDLIEAEKFYGEVCLTVECDAFDGYNSPTLVIPALKLQSTTDARINRNATYRAEVWNTRKRKKIFGFQSLTQFRVPFIDYTITWSDIIQFSTPLPIGPLMTLSDEIKLLISSQIASLTPSFSSGTPGTISRFRPSGLGLEDSNLLDTGSSFVASSSGFDLGSALLPFGALFVNDITASVINAGTGNFSGNVSVQGALSVQDVVDFLAGVVFNTNVDVEGDLNVNNLTVEGTFFAPAIAGDGGVFGNDVTAAQFRAGGATVPSGFGVTGFVGPRLAIWNNSGTQPHVYVNPDVTNTYVDILDTRNNEDVLSVRRITSMVADDGRFLVKAVGGGTQGFAGIRVNSQFERQRDSVDSIPVQTISRDKLLVTAAGFSNETTLQSYTIATNHPSENEGENYSFKVMGDNIGVVSNKILRVYINGIQIATRTIAAGDNFNWKATGSITMFDTGTGDYVAEAVISDDDGNTIGFFTNTGLTTLGGVVLSVTAEDDSVGETRAVFSEFFHNDWKS